MSTEKLSTVELKNLKQADIGRMLVDGNGLRGKVRQGRSGALKVSFEYKYRQGKKYRTASVGNWPEQSLSDIRHAFQMLRVQRREGIDPIEDRRLKSLDARVRQSEAIEQKKRELARIAAEAANKRTFGAGVEYWYRLELSRRKDGGAEAIRALNKDVLPLYENVPLVDIKRAGLLDIFDSVVARGSRSMANQLFADLKQFFAFAVMREWIDANPLQGIKKEQIGGKKIERDRHLSELEIRELVDTLPEAGLSKPMELAIWILLATCARVGELLEARWEHVDLEKREWKLPTSKNGKEHIIYLSSFTADQFKQLQEMTGYSPWCYPSRSGETHVDKKALTKQVRDRMRATPLKNRSQAVGTLVLSNGEWTPHDLRRTGATLMGELGVMGEVIEKCLNHVEPNRLRRIYQRQERKADMQKAWGLLGQKLDSLHSYSSMNNVVMGQF